MEKAIPDIGAYVSRAPDWVPLQGGGRINVSGRCWRGSGARRHVSINFDLLPEKASPLLPSIMKVLEWYLRNRSEHSAKGAFNFIKHFLVETSKTSSGHIRSITDVMLIDYAASLPLPRRWYLSNLASHLKNWYDLGYPGVSSSAMKFLRESRKPGNAKGKAVAEMDPQRGPFTDVEFESLNVTALDAFQEGRLAVRGFLLLALMMAFGPRPVQVRYLKVKDVRRLDQAEHGSHFQLDMPVVKNQLPPRHEFREFYLRNDFGTLLFDYAQDVRESMADIVEAPDEAPLFPCPNVEEERDDPAGLEFHDSTDHLTDELKGIVEGLGVTSERTGDALYVFPTRFRRSFGTRLGADGHPAVVIAHMLCHHDIQNVLVYTQASWAAMEKIDRAVAMMMAPLIQAFLGTIVMDESEAVRGDDPTSRIFDPRISKSMDVMGTCGKCGRCGFKAPIACYTCRRFQPWLDGPHGAVFEYLIQERDRLMKTDSKIASNLDRTILAVAEVIRRCAQVYEDLASMDSAS